MVVITAAPAALPPHELSLFCTTDELLSNSPILLFYGTSPANYNNPAGQQRISAHVFTPAGLQSFTRIMVSPTAPFYSAVTCLPHEEQGDEVCRGLAFSLYKYFAELPVTVKNVWETQCNSLGNLPSAPRLFTESHAAMLASRMVKVDNVPEVINDVREALGEQNLAWLDLDVVLPAGTIQKLENPRESNLFDVPEDEVLHQRYGQYAPIVKLFGEVAFIPTSKLRRAPSKPTALNRSQHFSRKQKETLRREMCELLDTEESYVSKVYELIHSVAADFRQKAKAKSGGSSSPSEDALKGLFPPSLDRILEVNSEFMEAIRGILEDTENDAIQDIERATDDVYVAPLRGQKDVKDVTGTLKLSKALVEWFPQFADCYIDYIQAHAEFSQLLKIFTKETGSSFSKRVHETGEQRLMSMLIEPVQRLPRYNLYIDNIVKQLPVRHPAIRSLLKARDIISEICSRDSPTSQQMKVIDRLRKMVFGWPPTFQPLGRLINAVDFVELAPPYRSERQNSTAATGIFLLFADSLILLNRPVGSTITARSVLTDVDTPKLAEDYSGSSQLIFHQAIRLSDVFLSDQSDGKTLQLLAPMPTPNQSVRPRSRDRLPGVEVRMFSLTGPYEGKAHKWTEDVTKARVEGRFPEAEREGYRWEVRTLSGDLSLFTAIFENDNQELPEGRAGPAKIRVVVDPSTSNKVAGLGENGIEAIACISILSNDFFLLEVNGINNYATSDQLTALEFLPVLTKRLSNFLQMRNNIKNPALAVTFLSRNQQILKSLTLQTEKSRPSSPQERTFRPPSPVKMLSNLFGGSVVKDSGGTRRFHRNPPSLSDFPRMAPPLGPPSRTQSRDGELSRPTSSSRTIGFNASELNLESISKLEETLATYVLALQARKGNIVGRTLRGRSGADELVVNELYNTLLEDPNKHDAAAQASVDVLFSAFEKFLKVAWTEKMGPVVSQPVLTTLQMRSDSMHPAEFEDFFRMTFAEIAPQNQHLLDGTGNDGDRGILTVAFAEVLVPEGSANDYISLLDRFINDIEGLFDEHLLGGLSTPSQGSMTSESRARSVNTGSMSSNASSLRKRFGFGTLSRENSKSEHESKVGSLWRTLSKTGHGGDSQPASISKATSLGRSNSTDTNIRTSPKRPSSRDRPTVLGAFSFENGEGFSGKSYVGAGLGTIGEVPPIAGPPRKKRRSSLSDLKSLQASANHTPTWSPQTPRHLDSAQRSIRQRSTSPHTPSPTKTITHIPTPTRLASPMRKDNSPANALDRPILSRPHSKGSQAPGKSDEVTAKSHSPSKRRTESISSIPTLKSAASSAGLSEKPTSGNVARLPPTPGSSMKPGASVSPPKRLRMQSPQKLRERLQNEQRAINSASKDLQAELSAIGKELAAAPSSSRPPRLATTASAPPVAPNARSLESRVSTLETTVRTTFENLNTRTDSISTDLISSLQVSETRVKKLDELYREANAENEALYARFNDELAKVMKAVKKGQGEDEVQRRLKEQQEEVARLRKENNRLKRETLGLRAQLRGD
ncbi:hypothetical protein BU16DRAFT_593264 [Lophium mytilinum]|uniref:DH domain-containing protein n=1 Tax=Lophium mytilinum TaxID=390894 RepID=A0A6A6QJ01_9PEZI|nr:hypothetical protein BU16DRAFT_593264 [Lophium mytilinum]